ncbi:sulfate/molybdate ABC transporter ATP-binding protein [Microbacterium sp. NPDC058345]|uniref:sulfate/molybdate ABC transporter ATP-binding protein n=1 Tax=Microbacterium sp. NPDC058345 TaxID=3346455 RepID=UPI003658CA1D
MSVIEGLHARIVVEREHFVVDVALGVAAGETVVVMGPSGAGKSTLLQALAGLVPLDDGEIVVDGRVVDRVTGSRVRAKPMRRGAVLLGQNPRLFPHLSVRENVAFGPRALGTDIRAARRDAEDWLRRVGLPGSGERMPHELSGGEAQRVAVARALAASPRIVLLDEPLIALDTETAGDIRQMLRDQLASSTTIAVTHDVADAVALADRLVVLETGRITQEGPVREVLAAPGSRFVASIAGLNRIVGAVSDGVWRAGDLHLPCAQPGPGTLAAVFRPTDVRMGEAVGGEPSWDTVVTRIEPTLLGVRVSSAASVVADFSLIEAGGLSPGDRIRVHVAPARVAFVPVS